MVVNSLTFDKKSIFVFIIFVVLVTSQYQQQHPKSMRSGLFALAFHTAKFPTNYLRRSPIRQNRPNLLQLQQLAYKSCTHTRDKSIMGSSSSSTPAEIIGECRSLSLFQETPLLKSQPMSDLVSNDSNENVNVYVKLDCLQSSGSFKDRGMAYFCYNNYKNKGITKFIGSSGGNAGLALAYVAGKCLGLNVSVIVPESTKQIVIDKLKSLNAKVTVHGKIWNEADTLARKLAQEDPNAEYVNPYDHPYLWTGHSTVVDEISNQIDMDNNRNDGSKKAGAGTIILGVGGGGLLCGILEGLDRNKSYSTNVIACETTGTNKFQQSFQGKKIVRLDAINSVATSLGALAVTEETLQRSQNHINNNKGTANIFPAVCTDEEAIDACIQFANDHRMLVEPACGAALAVIYSERLREQILSQNNIVSENKNIVVEVCGGSGVNIDLLQQWKSEILSK